MSFVISIVLILLTFGTKTSDGEGKIWYFSYSKKDKPLSNKSY